MKKSLISFLFIFLAGFSVFGENGLYVSLSKNNFYSWDGSNASMDASNKLTVSNGNGGCGAGFYFKADASSYKYAKISYQNLSIPNFVVRLQYADGAYSEVYLQPHFQSVYIELDSSRKSSITNLNFMTCQSEYQTGKKTSSVTLKDLSFVNEKTLSKKSAIADKKDGAFDDSITALEVSDKLALGYSMGCGLNRCPFYNDEKTSFAGFGFQNNYDQNGKPLVMQLESQKSALGNQAGGMAFELCETALVTKEFIDSIRDKGFKSIRIAVTWFPHIIDQNYTIDPYFMERVKEVVDWAISDGLYVLMNEHHSIHAFCPAPQYAQGYNLTKEAMPESERYLTAIYQQICQTFNGSYDQHLIFEILNEPRVIRKKNNADKNWDMWAPRASLLDDTGLSEPTKILNEYNQLIVDTIRNSGGNNAKRFIMVPTYATDYSTVSSKYFVLPQDSVQNKLMVAIHWYPLGFNTENKKRDSYSPALKKNFEKVFKAANERFVSNGVPVCITEFGIENDSWYDIRRKWFESPEVDRAERLSCLSDFSFLAGKYGLSALVWDDGCVHSVIRRIPPYASFDGDDFISGMVNAWEKGRSSEIKNDNKTESKNVGKAEIQKETSLLVSVVKLDAEDWSSSCLINLAEVKEGLILKFSVSKLSSAAYSQLRLCPEDSWTSLAMKEADFSSASKTLLLQDSADGNGKNITLNAKKAVFSYRLSAEDVEKIQKTGSLVIRGYGVRVEAVEVGK
ncbi:Endoglucanase [Treponema sp. JC4]|uniref:glycoside hydrolase family 5 protein n=1 Tax=Treponema sp. JC4 TaxID=1124982 RepID=UPI00025B0725|nr:glycoside hydrolase family 5 protein [Treponema sp. JC4]EID85240.1 Endoglucanase [Treponema sp. JC4]